MLLNVFVDEVPIGIQVPSGIVVAGEHVVAPVSKLFFSVMFGHDVLQSNRPAFFGQPNPVVFIASIMPELAVRDGRREMPVYISGITQFINQAFGCYVVHLDLFEDGQQSGG